MQEVQLFSVKLIGTHIVVERQVLCVAISSEQAENPLLLFNGQQSLAIIISVEGAMTAQIGLETLT